MKDAAEVITRGHIQQSLYISSDNAERLQTALHWYRYTCGQGMERDSLSMNERYEQQEKARLAAEDVFRGCLDEIKTQTSP